MTRGWKVRNKYPGADGSKLGVFLEEKEKSKKPV
jgi:hypothetical protein